jgi:DNA polymerase III subunit gamma/tau
MLIRRETNSGANSFLTVYRPCTINEFLGSDSTKSLIKSYLIKGTLPHVLLLTGDAGLGKTTLARIIALSLNCEEKKNEDPCLVCNSCLSILNSSSIDVHEINVGSSSGKDAVDDLVSGLSSAPFSSRHKILIFDEAHRLSSAAQALLLKHMEECYSHVYIILCTNEPEKLLSKLKDDAPFLDRCKILNVTSLTDDDMFGLLENVSQFEGANYNVPVLNYISGLSLGIPRKALNYLDTVITEGSWSLDNVKPLLSGIILDEDDPEVLELSRALLKKDFKTSYELFEQLVKKFPVESIRIAVCGFFVGCLKRSYSSGNGKNLSNALTQLTTPIYLTGKPSEHLFMNIMYKVVVLLGA